MKNILITGASGDLGGAIARKIASEIGEECNFLLHYNNNKKSVLALAQEIGGGICKANIIKADFSDIKQVENMCKRIQKEFGHIDILINNSAIVVDADLDERSVEIFEKTLRCNLTVPFYLCKTFGLQMNERGEGKIINISSTNGIDYNSPYSLDYDASKSGLISLTKNMAMLLDKVNVNCVCPHWIDTKMNAGLEEDYLKEEAKKILKGRFAKPEEIAEFVWFLLSSKADYLTGQIYSFGSYRY